MAARHGPERLSRVVWAPPQRRAPPLRTQAHPRRQSQGNAQQLAHAAHATAAPLRRAAIRRRPPRFRGLLAGMAPGEDLKEDFSSKVCMNINRRHHTRPHLNLSTLPSNCVRNGAARKSFYQRIHLEVSLSDVCSKIRKHARGSSRNSAAGYIFYSPQKSCC